MKLRRRFIIETNSITDEQEDELFRSFAGFSQPPIGSFTIQVQREKHPGCWGTCLQCTGGD